MVRWQQIYVMVSNRNIEHYAFGRQLNSNLLFASFLLNELKNDMKDLSTRPHDQKNRTYPIVNF